MKTELLKIKGSWEEVVDDCRATVSKPPLGHEPSDTFKRKILICRAQPHPGSLRPLPVDGDQILDRHALENTPLGE